MYAFIYISNDKIEIRNEDVIVGKIINIRKSDNKLSYEIKNKEKILVNYYNGDLNFKLGDTIKVFGKYKEIEENSVFNLFNYKKYLLSKNIK